MKLRRDDRLVFIWIALTVVLYIHNALFLQSVPAVYIESFFLCGIGAVLSYRSDLIMNMFFIGLIAGFVELLGDFFLVNVAGTLSYPFILPPLLSSPVYMPFAWALVITHLGYIGRRVEEEFNGLLASIVPAGLAMLLVGFYESFAFHSGAWEYINPPIRAVAHTPLFIVTAEGIMFSTIARITHKKTVVAGVTFGLVITVSYMITYYLFSLL